MLHNADAEYVLGANSVFWWLQLASEQIGEYELLEYLIS